MAAKVPPFEVDAGGGGNVGGECAAPSAFSSKLHAALAAFRADCEMGIVQVSMMGFQQETVVGSMVGPIQSVYVVQFGAHARILSDYLLITLPLNFAASCVAVAALVGASMRHSWSLFMLGCWMSLAASIALTFPPTLNSTPEAQAKFLSNYFGVLFVLASVGAKLRDYPLNLARVYLLPDTMARAREHAYTKMCSVMLGNATTGGLMLCMLARPTRSVQLALAALQCVSTLISVAGASALRRLDDSAEASRPGSERLDPEARISGDASAGSNAGSRRSSEARGFEGGGRIFRVLCKLAANSRLWQLLLVVWCSGFITTLNSQCTGAIYWSSVVGVGDHMRSVFIALQSVLGGGLLGFATTLYVTRLYHTKVHVPSVIPRIVAVGAVFGSVILAIFGTTCWGALVGVTSLYLYYLVAGWYNIEYLKLLDSLSDSQDGDSPMVYMLLVKDIASGVLDSVRNAVLLWLIASTGFYEPDCSARCRGLGDPSCHSRCRAEARASVSRSTVALVWALYVFVTPGAYLVACWIIWRYPSACSLLQKPAYCAESPILRGS